MAVFIYFQVYTYIYKLHPSILNTTNITAKIPKLSFKAPQSKTRDITLNIKVIKIFFWEKEVYIYISLV